MPGEDKIRKEKPNLKNKTTMTTILLITLFLTVISTFVLKKFHKRPNRLDKSKDRNIEVYNEIEDRMHVFSRIELNTSEHPDNAVTIRIKADSLGLDVEEFKRIHNEAVGLHKEISFPQNLLETSMVLNRMADEIAEAFDRHTSEFVKLERRHKVVEMRDAEFESQLRMILSRIYDLCDKYSKLELQYKILIESIKENKEDISNFDFESFGYLNSKIEGFKLYLNFYDRMDLE